MDNSLESKKRKRDASRVLLYLPPGTKIPSFFTQNENDAQKISDALRVGATAVESSLADMSSQNYERTLASEREKLVLQQGILHQKALAELEESLVRKNSQLNLELDRMKMQRDEFHERLERERAMADAERERERAFFRSQMDGMQAALSNVQQEREFSKEQLALSQRAADRSAQNSSVKGAEGEAEVEKVIRNAFALCPGFSIINESKQAGRGDRLATLMGLRVMFEIKSHAALRDNAAATGKLRKVEKKEVQKLQDNAASGLDMDVCVMVALHTTITGHDSHPVTAEYAGRVLIIYVNQLFGSATPPIDILQWHVGSLLTAHARLKELTEIRAGPEAQGAGAEAPDQEEVQQRVAKLSDQIASFLADAAKQHSERRRLLAKHQTLINASIQELVQDHQKTEIATQEGLGRLLQQARAMGGAK
jgi:hypothetical protein